MYFKDFPKTLYLFGDEISPTAIQDLSKFSNFVNDISDKISAYIEYDISDFERPDTLSHRLYGTSEYDWTFFLMNHKLLERGWPLSAQDVYTLGTKKLYRDWTCPLELNLKTADSAASVYESVDAITGEKTILYPVGQEVLLNGKKMIVKSKNLDVGEITLRSPTYNPDRDSDFNGFTTLTYPNATNLLPITNTFAEYLGTYEYRNEDNIPIDYFDAGTPDFPVSTTKTPITNITRLIEENDELKNIRIIKKENIVSVAGKLRSLIGR